MSYLQDRLKMYGISEEVNQTHVFAGNPNAEKPTFELRKERWFSEDTHNNIKILFKSLDNRHKTLHTSKRKTVEKIYRTCLSPKNRENYAIDHGGKKAKYIQPAGTGSIIFHTQGVIDAFLAEDKKSVKTLYLVEGEFKAFTAWMHSKQWTPNKHQIDKEPNLPPPTGLPIMGITGIRNLFGDDGDLHNDIAEFIRVCQPENVVFIMDADFRSLPTKYHPEESPDIDLANRLKNFYQATIDFRSILKGRVRDLYLVNVSEPMLHEVIPNTKEPIKGLDDLLASGLKNPSEFLFDLCKSIRPKTHSAYFQSIDVVASMGQALKKHFLLTYKSSAPLGFYEANIDVLKEHEFRFNGCRYQFNDDVLAMTVHGDSDQYIRVATDYFKMIGYPDAYGNTIRELIKWSKAEIKEDYEKLGYKNFITSIPKYNRFVNVPANNIEEYQQEIDSCFNLYYKIDHEPRKGKWPIIKKFLQHIFGERKEYDTTDQYDVVLDWISIAWNTPTQKLPAICLVSEEKSTGKSIYLELLNLIFQDNMAIIGNQEITDRFNDDYITKNVIGLNESFIDKKTTIEKIKTNITEPHANMDTKNVSRCRIDMFAKYVLTSNNVWDFIRIDDDENRFWVRYVHPFEGPEIPDLLEQMSREVSAFVYYLKNEHKLKNPRKTRLHFAPDVYVTDTLKELQKESKSTLYKNIEITIEEEFTKFNGHPDQKVHFPKLYYSITEICDLVYGPNRLNEKNYVLRVLKREFKLVRPDKSVSKKRPAITNEIINDQDESFYTEGKSEVGRFF